MCIAILNTHTTLPPSYIENSWENNDQGGGLLWIEKKQLKVFKTYVKKELADKYYEIRKDNTMPILLHFRIATSGHNFDNLHPFLVHPTLGMIHNGVIGGLGNHQESDTNELAQILSANRKYFHRDDNYIRILGDLIKSTNKLVFLDNEGQYAICNEKSGSWDTDGNWFSNNSHLRSNDYKWFGSTKVYNHGANQKVSRFNDFEYENYPKGSATSVGEGKKSNQNIGLHLTDFEQKCYDACCLILGVDNKNSEEKKFMEIMRDEYMCEGWADFFETITNHDKI